MSTKTRSQLKSNKRTNQNQGGGDKKEGGTYKFWMRGARPKGGDSNRQSQSLAFCFKLPGGATYPANQSGCQ